MTSDVQAWLTGQPNYGWLIRLSDGSDLVLNLASNDHGVADLRPELLLTLRTGAELATATPTSLPRPTPTPSGGGGGQTFALLLSPGWNAVSIPVIPGDPSLPNVFSSIDGSYDSVQWYDNVNVSPPRWRHYAPGDPTSDLLGVPELLGVWIHMNQQGVLRVTGPAPRTTVIHLRPGWNQIGFPALRPQNVASTLGAIAGSYDRVSVWDNVARLWRSYAPGDRNNTLSQFRPGDAIWIHATREVNLTIVN